LGLMAVPGTLRAAAALISVEAVVESAVIAHREELTPGLRVMLILFLSLKWLFSWRALKLRPGPMMGLFLLEGTSAVAALGAVHAPTPARLALAGAAVLACVLLAASLHAFPTPEIPRP
jgi:hypothetical protein